MGKTAQILVILALMGLPACRRAGVPTPESFGDNPQATDDPTLTTDEDIADDATPADVAMPKGGNVLFIGNSYTYVNDLPGMTVQFAHSGGAAVQQTSVTLGGATLAGIIAQTQAVATIAQGGWRFVVLQGQSVEPAGDLADFLPAAHTLSDDAHAAGATVAFYQTWPRKAGDALYQQAWTGGTPQALAKLLKDGYQQAADQNAGIRVPVGDAWMLALAQYPEINLYQADGSHPVTAGTYLAACVFSVTLFSVDPMVVAWAPPDLDPTQAWMLRKICQRATSGP